MTFNFENILILFFSLLAVVSAVLMISRRSPINSALFLILNFFCISALYLFLRAQFIAIIQVLVYAGAIMVLFLFVIMLLNLQDPARLTERVSYKKLTAILLSLMLFSILSITTYFAFRGKFPSINPVADQLGTVEMAGRELYTTYSFPFEIVSFILIAAIVGAILLAKKKFE